MIKAHIEKIEVRIKENREILLWNKMHLKQATEVEGFLNERHANLNIMWLNREIRFLNKLIKESKKMN